MEAEDSYLTLAGNSEAIYKEKGSKFLAFAYPVSSEEEIKEHLESLRKKYFDARHHCYAYMLGKEMTQYRANDDGEPNHSAGDPILGQIRSNQLTNVLIVVIRYFGGTKLGVSGLIQAYKTAAGEAIAANTIVTEILCSTVSVSFDYIQMNQVMKIIKDYQLDILEQTFDNTCLMKIKVRQALTTEVREKFAEVANVD
ncbi:IMPACT family protein [Mongoliitalea daihaiensis]|uniref:IMPACT family protein n=1 Tax=Mongoliitalea daihaiensis TaxID=2782006 RepID=UPI001F320381|nr:YigZ family protein [Mongoliitalea daihaiensis]UJP67054.1 YigZ family protein [Mongoliitalea daihaiensis]